MGRRDGVVRRGAAIDSGSVDVRLERRSHLAQCLGGAVELGKIEIAPAHHGFDFSRGVINRDQGALHARILFEADSCFAIASQRNNLHVNDVAGQHDVLQLAARPDSVGWYESRRVAAELDRN